MRDWEGYGALAEQAAEQREEQAERLSVKTWTTRDGKEIPIPDMGDTHLLRAYKVSRDDDLLREMVVRLFAAHITNTMF
jgi:hypothetical protein